MTRQNQNFQTTGCSIFALFDNRARRRKAAPSKSSRSPIAKPMTTPSQIGLHRFRLCSIWESPARVKLTASWYNAKTRHLRFRPSGVRCCCVAIRAANECADRGSTSALRNTCDGNGLVRATGWRAAIGRDLQGSRCGGAINARGRLARLCCRGRASNVHDLFRVEARPRTATSLSSYALCAVR